MKIFTNPKTNFNIFYLFYLRLQLLPLLLLRFFWLARVSLLHHDYMLLRLGYLSCGIACVPSRWRAQSFANASRLECLKDLVLWNCWLPRILLLLVCLSWLLVDIPQIPFPPWLPRPLVTIILSSKLLCNENYITTAIGQILSRGDVPAQEARIRRKTGECLENYWGTSEGEPLDTQNTVGDYNAKIEWKYWAMSSFVMPLRCVATVVCVFNHERR